MKSSVVIGSGIGGLAAAIRLAARGHQVDVFEGNEYPGGKLREKRVDGYRFDMGPSVFTMPELIDELFTLCGKNPRDYFTYTRLETYFRYFFDDGTIIKGYADVEKFAKELASHSTDSEESFWKYVKDVKAKLDITKGVFIENSLHVPTNYLTKRVLYGVLNFDRVGAFESMHEGNKKYFSDPRLVQLFDHYAFYVGSNPLVAPATLNMISYIVMVTGAFMPDRGMYSMVLALVQLAEEMKVKFHFNTQVDEILIEANKAVGIRTGEQQRRYDVVVSNMDIYFTYHKLLPNEKKPKLILDQPKSSSVIGFYWGVKGQHPNMSVHNMLFSDDEKAEYNAVFNAHTVSDVPSIYICITCKHVKGDAPEGCENWFIIVTAPHEQGQDWNELVDRSRKNVFERVLKLTGIDLPSKIESETVLTPAEVEAKYRSAFGSVYGNSSNGKFAAFLRHPNFSKKIRNLYFVGGSVHPGAGIPMCLNSAKIMDKVLKD